MSDPAFNDNDWDELARELNVQKSPPRSDLPQPESELSASGDVESMRPSDAREDEAGFELEDAEEADGESADGEGESAETQPGEDQPGAGRKRRKRRRRRKKGGPGQPGTEPAAGAEIMPGDESERPALATVARPAPLRTAFDEQGPEDMERAEDESAGIPPAADEETGGEMLRELIANWNGPSWDELVGGLYRPER